MKKENANLKNDNHLFRSFLIFQRTSSKKKCAGVSRDVYVHSLHVYLV